LIVKELFATLQKSLVWPQRVLDFAHLEKPRAYFEEPLWITE
jgi:hypothetical protein